ncbi:MAG: response regulator, partial [Bacteroidetes bacterium]|nr:response regulator [Bacteroidota bacterium]
QWVDIKVEDTGIGIPADKKELIFQRFFQNVTPGSIVNAGTGIGLSITKEFVRLHGGTISVESEVGKGSVFIVRLPMAPAGEAEGQRGLEDRSIGEEEVSGADEQPGQEAFSKKAGLPVQKPIVLLVEDNEDFRFYLKDNLKALYTVVEAANGNEGWKKALSCHPNLIVSDVSMPYMDGITLTRQLKGDKRTAHVPVILLTALAEQGQQLAGLETGANDYITKPFDFELLLAKIRNLLELSRTLRTTYTKQISVGTAADAGAKSESADEKLIREVVACIEANLDNPQFSVEFLSRQLVMSRTTLYNKLLELTGETPVEFVRSIRLGKASVLLQDKDLTISEIAYKVGFSSPNYFARAFKAKYRILPSEYAQRFRKQGQDDPF